MDPMDPTGMDDKHKGLLLALSSSLFIGASFIIKKKGLRKAGATGVRAGEYASVPSIFALLSHYHVFITMLTRVT